MKAFATVVLSGAYSVSAVVAAPPLRSVSAPSTERSQHIPAAASGSSTLPAGAPVLVMTNQELSTTLNHAGDKFEVTVLNDVSVGGTVVIPKGTIGFGEVTFRTNNGAFGKPGILGISLRSLDLRGKDVLLDGHYREEGANKNGATVATWLAVGVFAGFIRGKPGVIPKGRELKAHTGEDISFVPADPLPAANTPAMPVDAVDLKPSKPAEQTASTIPDQ